jgi:hypothetical protein
MMIHTTQGDIDEHRLVRKDITIGGIHIVEYYLEGELVQRSTALQLRGVTAQAVAKDLTR